MNRSTQGLCVLVLALVLTPDSSSALPDLLAPFRSMFGMGSKTGGSGSSSPSSRPYSSKSPYGGHPGGSQSSPEDEEGGGFGPFRGFEDSPGGPSSRPSPPPGIPYTHQQQGSLRPDYHRQSHSPQRPQHSSGSLPVRSQHSSGNVRPVRQQPGFPGPHQQSFRGNGPYGRPHGGGGPSHSSPEHTNEGGFASGGPPLPPGFTEGKLPLGEGEHQSSSPGGHQGRPSYNPSEEQGGPGGPPTRGRPSFGPSDEQGGPGGPRGRPSFGPNGPSDEQEGPGGPRGRPSFGPSGEQGGYQPESDSPGPYPGGPPGGHSFDDGPPSYSSEGGRGPPSRGRGPPQSTENYGGFGPFGGPSEENDSPGGPQPFHAASPSRKPFKPSRPLPSFNSPEGSSSFPPGPPSDYPEQFEGGPRDTRQPPEVITADDVSKYPPQISEESEGGPGGPPPGFGNFGGFGNSPSSSPSEEDDNGPPRGFSRPTSYRGDGGPPQGFPGSRPGKIPRYRPAGTSPYAYRTQPPNPMMMSGSGPLPSKRPHQRNYPKHNKRSGDGGIVTLESPKDPNYIMASSDSPAVFDEPTSAASGHGGVGGHEGLSNNGDRILYHVGGHQGPHSYRFGYDTGKGSYNRLFRFEEKDGKGYVKGKYGFYDKHGKLNVVNYEAHPKHGFTAERGHTHGYYKK